jgi:hypothetical protein
VHEALIKKLGIDDYNRLLNASSPGATPV